jgi:hypothetical protein
VILSKREKKIAIGVGIAAVVLILDLFLLDPFLDRKRAIASETAKTTALLDRGRKLVRQERDLKPDWAKITSGGLKAEHTEAESQLENAMQEWINDSGLKLTAQKPDRPSTDGKFDVVGIRFTAEGSMRSIGKLVWALETSSIPIRVNDLQVTPQKEGTDVLQVQANVSTLSVDSKELGTPATRTSGPRANAGGRP